MNHRSVGRCFTKCWTVPYTGILKQFPILIPLTTTTDSRDFSRREICSSGYDDENVNDRKRKRLMKNRELASRSRARKQAYTHELELEVAHLVEENAKLRKQQQKIYVAALGYNKQQKREKLYRTLTAPF